MRVLTQGELARCTRTELAAMLRRIATELPPLPEREAKSSTLSLGEIGTHSGLTDGRKLKGNASANCQPRLFEIQSWARLGFCPPVSDRRFIEYAAVAAQLRIESANAA